MPEEPATDTLQEFIIRLCGSLRNQYGITPRSFDVASVEDMGGGQISVRLEGGMYVNIEVRQAE